ncbi:transmembrane protein 68-like [Chanos chanos]|uniref:Transmembrane protein 68-like n=1 Tax=Chanos chanos TaxID=29144 RepID=A0A6J2VTJ0_CHACN|nr:transmembrane protein 68-like [Chanos chanos]
MDVEASDVISCLWDLLWWACSPFVLVFLLPFVIVFFLYLSILFLHLYKRKNELKEAYTHTLWQCARRTLATLWDAHATVWHGYELHGLEKIPDSGPALIVYYHGAIPIDYYYFLARVIILKGRTCHSVADHILFKMPGFKLLLEVFSVIHGPREECVRALRNGHLLGISPGGVREALLSDQMYPLMWGKRTGFAQVAIDSGVPVIPMFTQNVREGFRSLGTLRFFRWVYERYRVPIAPVYGGFPVKFRTYLGDPIPYDPSLTAEKLAEKVQLALQALIEQHQKIPGSIVRALLERFQPTDTAHATIKQD